MLGCRIYSLTDCCYWRWMRGFTGLYGIQFSRSSSFTFKSQTIISVVAIYMYTDVKVWFLKTRVLANVGVLLPLPELNSSYFSAVCLAIILTFLGIYETDSAESVLRLISVLSYKSMFVHCPFYGEISLWILQDWVVF